MKNQPTHDFTALADDDVKASLAQLQKASISSYRATMHRLGAALAARSRLTGAKVTAVVTTPEDADFLTAGFLESASRARLVCYWTERSTSSLGDVATVVQQFVEPGMPKQVDTVVVLKSIISSGCIVRTHLEQFLEDAKPRRIVIAAPVMLKGADTELRKQFPKKVAALFEFVTFAIDTQKRGNVVLPGVGGWVEERLGLKTRRPRFVPSLVEQRQAASAA
ncbi:MAG: hypothetical protein DI536_18395 [Archangium gephyra]|uniref:Uncharacterized protein n=1 Tax=Archangium gephyra TaxID=48 RepID=A0A2W5UPX7_9BACT|nr:MAG: hypothetical protein DI536_18395 [Archangium gephyra]